MTDHDTYIAAAPEQFRPLLHELRAQLASALPDAEEVIEYNMPLVERLALASQKDLGL